MIEGFERVNEAQFKVLKDAISWITALIAGADGIIDPKETEWAEKLTKIRSYANPNQLTEFYSEVGKDFSENLNSILVSLPESKIERETLLSDKLVNVNEILEKIDNALAYQLYSSYLSFAKHIAQQTGGILGFFSIDKYEGKLISLPMIQPVELKKESE